MTQHSVLVTDLSILDSKKTDLDTWRTLYAPDFIGCDPRTLHTLEMIRRVADSDCDVLITGASGTGKELVARCIHMASTRRHRPFVAINCAAIPKELMESEIFGHTRGAFTGATDRRIGKFELANSGTLFLDETGEMDLSLQGKFLRVLQEREITAIGDHKTIKIDVRIISATNQDLKDMCLQKTFREDLYYRLNVIPIHLPQIIDRPQDISLLLRHFIKKASIRHNRHISDIDAEALKILQAYQWPGNIREMQNLIERIVVLKSDNDICIKKHDLELHMSIDNQHTQADIPNHFEIPEKGIDINEMLENIEIQLTLQALKRSSNNKQKAADLLGLKRTTLVERLKKLNINI